MQTQQIAAADLGMILTPFLLLGDFVEVTYPFVSTFGIKGGFMKDILASLGDLEIRLESYEVHFLDLRWLEGFGGSVTVQFRKPFSIAERLLPERHRKGIQANEKVLSLLQGIINAQIVGYEFEVVPLAGRDPIDGQRIHSWQGRFKGYVNDNWKYGREASPLIISVESNEKYWFVMFHFNPGGFERAGHRTRIREDWLDNASCVSESIRRSVERGLKSPTKEVPTRLNLDEFREEMVTGWGEDVIPHIDKLWSKLTESLK